MCTEHENNTRNQILKGGFIHGLAKGLLLILYSIILYILKILIT
jgi:hypothetical protein